MGILTYMKRVIAYGTIVAGVSWPVVYDLGYNKGVIDASLGKKEIVKEDKIGKELKPELKSLDDIFSDKGWEDGQHRR